MTLSFLAFDWVLKFYISSFPSVCAFFTDSISVSWLELLSICYSTVCVLIDFISRFIYIFFKVFDNDHYAILKSLAYASALRFSVSTIVWLLSSGRHILSCRLRIVNDCFGVSVPEFEMIVILDVNIWSSFYWVVFSISWILLPLLDLRNKEWLNFLVRSSSKSLPSMATSGGASQVERF